MLITILALLINNCIVNTGIPRNDPNYTIEYFEIDYDELLRILSSLRELNDTYVNNLVTRINESIKYGNYSGVYDNLYRLKTYLENNYGSSDNEFIQQLLSLLRSIDSVNDKGVVLDAGELLKMLKETNSVDTNRTVNIDLHDLIKKLSIRNISYPGTGGSLVKYPGLDGGLTNSLKGFTFIYTLPVDLIILSTTTLAILLLIFIKRDYIIRGTTRLKSRLATRLKSAAFSISSIVKKPIDSVIDLYNKWYLKAKIKGYNRFRWETIREFVERIKEDDLRESGRLVTSLYEERVYGLKEIDQSRLEDVSKHLA